MNNALLKMYVKMQALMVREEGQDLIEYILLVALISVALVATLNTLSAKLVTVLTTITGDL